MEVRWLVVRSTIFVTFTCDDLVCKEIFFTDDFWLEKSGLKTLVEDGVSCSCWRGEVLLHCHPSAVLPSSGDVITVLGEKGSGGKDDV